MASPWLRTPFYINAWLAVREALEELAPLSNLGIRIRSGTSPPSPMQFQLGFNAVQMTLGTSRSSLGRAIAQRGRASLARTAPPAAKSR
jgi:hypothetical protein